MGNNHVTYVKGTFREMSCLLVLSHNTDDYSVIEENGGAVIDIQFQFLAKEQARKNEFTYHNNNVT
jgi:hypothetical protein